MAADYRLKQNLKMSPNAQIKNLVPENLSEVPPQDEWKLGRFWFNSTIGKLQGVFLKLDTSTGLPVEPQEMEVRIVGADALGPTMDGQYWPDGLFDFNEQTKIADAMDDVNEALKDLAPAEATMLRGDLDVKNEFKTGRISKQNSLAPDIIRLTGTTEGALIDYIITEAEVEASLPTEGLVVKNQKQQQFGKADQGVISAFYNDAQTDDGLNLKEIFNEASRDYFGVVQGFDPEIQQEITDINGNTTTIEVNPNKDSYRSATGSLTVNTVERYNDFKKWQRGTGTVNFNVTPGRQTFYVEHRDFDSGLHSSIDITPSYKTNTSAIFYDPNKTAPTSTILGFNILTGTSKTISGITFYTSNISFSLDARVENLFNYTYWDEPVEISGDGTDAGLLAWNHQDSNLNESTVPSWNDIYDLTNHTINYTKTNSKVDEVTVSIRGGKVATGWGEPTTLTKKILIDTTQVSGNSSLLKETFLDEDYRFNPEAVDFDSILSVNNSDGSWDSNKILNVGEAQQFQGTLQIPQNSYVVYDINVDYSVFEMVDETVYYRRFNSVNKANSNGILKITTPNVIGTDFDVYIKFPEITGWLDTKELFDSELFTIEYMNDGTACGTSLNKSTTGYEIPWSIGTFSTADSGYGYVIKVVLRTQDTKITEIEEISENWR